MWLGRGRLNSAVYPTEWATVSRTNYTRAFVRTAGAKIRKTRFRLSWLTCRSERAYPAYAKTVLALALCPYAHLFAPVYSASGPLSRLLLKLRALQMSHCK